LSVPALADPPKKEITWIDSLEDGLAEARRQRRPVLVEGQAQWCGWCRKLEQEFARARCRRIAALDAGEDRYRRGTRRCEEAGGRAGAGLARAVAGGQVLASHDGYLPADKLVAWLKEQYERHRWSCRRVERRGTPAAETIKKLVAILEHRDAELREAAVQRSLPCRSRGRAGVGVLRSGSLAGRLTALEVLREWGAPIQTLDRGSRRR